MQNNSRNFKIYLLKALLIIFVASIPFSRAVLSISGLSIFVLSLALINTKKLQFDKSYLLLIFLILVCFADFFRADNIVQWKSEILIKLPLILLPIPIIFAQNTLGRTYLKFLLITFIITILVSSSISVINYFLNFEELNKLVLQSKNIPVSGGMHHITFSVYCAIAVFISIFIAVDYKIKWMYLAAGINLINLHILSARTGLAGFYFASFALAIILVFKNKQYLKFVLPLIILLILFPVIAFFTVKSFKNRAINTLDDIKTTINQSDANYKSMAMRVEATKIAWKIFIKNPIAGVGTGNLRKQMDIEYERQNTNLFMENRILPHNQFILEAATRGILGLIPIILFVFSPLFLGINKLAYPFLTLWILLTFGLFFECFFERQHGIILVSFFWFLLLNYNNFLNNIKG